MTSVNLQRASDWLQVVNMLPVLVELHLSKCQLDNIPPSLRYVNFTSLAVLHLSANFLEYTIPTWFYNLSSLFYLDLRFNNLQGQIPNEIGNLNSLEYLDLSRNIDSKVKLPNTFWNLCNLRVLDLSYNNFSGESLECRSNVSMCIGKSLEKLALSNSQLTGCIPEWFGQLNHLKYLHLSHNSLSGHIPGSLGNLSSLEKLFLHNNQLYGNLPESFGQLSNLHGRLIYRLKCLTRGNIRSSLHQTLQTEILRNDFEHFYLYYKPQLASSIPTRKFCN
ncbi:hypothetical protein L1049_021595 [Liquidambar formosana]|uniref:Uncharacterized protein n=1 Tax=Liquidambar formosana TaxID=63359 RepID=A0AAP0R2S6_LIQFO